MYIYKHDFSNPCFLVKWKRKKLLWFKCIGDLIIEQSCLNPWEAKTIPQMFSNIWI
jgi:hypothetical protein